MEGAHVKKTKDPQLDLPRIGFDRILLSAPNTNRARQRAGEDDFPPTVAGYRLRRDYRPMGRSYERCAEYRHETDLHAPIVDFLYRPVKDYCPPFRVQLRATMARLLHQGHCESIIDRLTRSLRTNLVATEVELTIDFEGGFTKAEDLHRELYQSRARHATECWAEDGEDGPERTWYRGARRSWRSVRVYPKREDGRRVARVEWILRRPLLKRLGVEDIADLRRVDWPDPRITGSRFVKFVAEEFRGDVDRAQMYGDLIAMLGPNVALQQIPRKNRHRVRQCFRPTENQRVVERLLANLARRLRRRAG